MRSIITEEGHEVVPEQRNLHQVGRPPHEGRLHQVVTKDAGPAIANHLGGGGDEKRNEVGELPLVKGLHNGDNVDGISSSSSGIGEDCNKHMLLDVEGAGVHRPLPRRERYPELPCGQHSRHEAAEREAGDLGRHSTDAQGLCPVGEKLVKECEDDAREQTERPHAEGEDRHVRVIGRGHCECHLLHWGVLHGIHLVVVILHAVILGWEVCRIIICTWHC